MFHLNYTNKLYFCSFKEVGYERPTANILQHMEGTHITSSLNSPWKLMVSSRLDDAIYIFTMYQFWVRDVDFEYGRRDHTRSIFGVLVQPGAFCFTLFAQLRSTCWFSVVIEEFQVFPNFFISVHPISAYHTPTAIEDLPGLGFLWHVAGLELLTSCLVRFFCTSERGVVEF